MEFKGSSEFSLGMEIELQLLNSQTLELTDGIIPLLAKLPQNSGITAEFNQAMVEINSKVCFNLPELEADILTKLRDVKTQCAALGMTICTAGSHPLCHRFVTVTPYPRYLQQQITSGYLAGLMMTCATQVHIGVPSGDIAMDIMARLKPYLPILLALSASSPFWWGNDTAFASYRHRFLSSLRNYGIPPDFASWQDFAKFFAVAQHARIFEIIRDIHWDIRPQPDLGTLEIRVMDAQPTVRESLLLAGLIHALVLYLYEYPQGEFLLTPLPMVIERENHFRASRWGLDANYIEDKSGNTRPIRVIIKDILSSLSAVSPVLAELETRLLEGASYSRQRRVFQETCSLRAVVAALVKELDAELGFDTPHL